MSCKHCEETKIYAKGYCKKCYMRVLRTGTAEYTRNFIKTDSHCTVEGCHNPVIAKGMCEAHYRTHIKYGSTESPFGYGERRKHPLYGIWQWQVRVKEKRCTEWDDFWQFVTDVGESPGKDYTARRQNVKEPWSKSNFLWKKKINHNQGEPERQRIWRQQNPLKTKSYDLKRNFGITLEEYLNMYDAQKGCCAICGIQKNSYTQTLTKGGEGGRNTLIVDHNHTTGAVRKLLCHQCNKGLGALQDSVEILKKAIKYLTQHTE